MQAKTKLEKVFSVLIFNFWIDYLRVFAASQFEIYHNFHMIHAEVSEIRHIIPVPIYQPAEDKSRKRVS